MLLEVGYKLRIFEKGGDSLSFKGIIYLDTYTKEFFINPLIKKDLKKYYESFILKLREFISLYKNALNPFNNGIIQQYTLKEGDKTPYKMDIVLKWVNELY